MGLHIMCIAAADSKNMNQHTNQIYIPISLNLSFTQRDSVEVTWAQTTDYNAISKQIIWKPWKTSHPEVHQSIIYFQKALQSNH